MSALEVSGLAEVLRRPARHPRGEPRRRAGRAPADHRPERRRQDHAVQPDHRRAAARPRHDPPVRPRASPAFPSRRRAHLGLARTYQIITLFPRETLLRNVMLSLLGLSRPALESVRAGSTRQAALIEAGRGGARAGRARHISPSGRSAQTSYGERRRVEIAMALAQNPKVLLLDEPFAGLSIEERRDVQDLLAAIPRDVTIVMIEHDMDVALDFAERITVLHFGEVVVEGTPRRGGRASRAPGRSTLANDALRARRHRRLLRRQPRAAPRVASSAARAGSLGLLGRNGAGKTTSMNVTDRACCRRGAAASRSTARRSPAGRPRRSPRRASRWCRRAGASSAA